MNNRHRYIEKVIQGRSSVLLIARLVEQGSLAVMLLVLARRSEPREFAPVSILFIINSFAVAASDYGLGLDLLRLPADKKMATRSFSRIRVTNTLLAIPSLLFAVAVRSSTGILIAFGALIWWFSAEAYVRNAGALRRGLARHTASADIVGSLIALLVTLTTVGHGPAVVVAGLALTLRHMFGAALIRDWRLDFSPEGKIARPTAPWFSQILSFATANVDYLIGGIVLGPAFLSLYLVAFRLSNAAPSQIAGVATRLAVTDFAGLPKDRLNDLYQRWTNRMGLVAGSLCALTIAGTPLLPHLLGRSWNQVVPIALVLSIAVPARLLIGLAGALALAVDKAGALVVMEMGRMGATAGVLLVAGMFGESWFVSGSAIAAILSSVLIHGIVTHMSGVRLPSWTWKLALIFSLLAGVCGKLLV